MSSKIKVDTIENVAGSGNVSLGSGHNLVVPGDLTVDTSTLKIDSSNNRVGIGTTSPSDALHVKGFTQIESTAGNAAYVRFNNTVNSGGKTWRAGAGVSSHGSFSIYNQTDNKFGVTVDSSGRVTKPNQPSFLAFGANIGSESTAGLIAYPNITAVQGGHNIGSHYNTSTYKFTAPVAGKYLFGFSVYAHTTNALDMYGRLNDSVNVSGHQVNAGSNDDNYPTLAGSVLINMAANDTFGWRMISGSYHTNSTGSYFYGFLSH